MQLPLHLDAIIINERYSTGRVSGASKTHTFVAHRGAALER